MMLVIEISKKKKQTEIRITETSTFYMSVTKDKKRFAQESTAAFGLMVFIRPGLPSRERQTIEDALMEIGCEVDGGSSRGVGESDVSLRVDSVKAMLPSIIAVLRAANVGEGSTILQKMPSKVVYRVYEDSDVLITRIPAESKKPWWKFW